MSYNQTLSSIDNSETVTIRDVNKYVMIILYIIVAIISLISNSLIIFVVGFTKKLRTNSYYLLVSLAVTDFTIIVVGIPVHIMNIMADKLILDSTGCKVHCFFTTVPFQSSLYHLSLIAFHRYILTVRREYYNKLFSGRKILYFLIPVWFIPMIICSLPFLGYGKIHFEKSREICIFAWNTFHKSFVFSFVFIIFHLNVCIMVYCYFQILKNLRKKVKVKERQLDQRSTYMMIVVVLTCVFCFTPQSLTVSYELITKKSTPQVYGFLSLLFMYSNSMFDFIIYSAMNSTFRNSFKSLCNMCQKKSQRIVPIGKLGVERANRTR